MRAFSVVRFRIKPDREDAFVQAHRRAEITAEGFRRGALVKTGERTCCMVGEWDSGFLSPQSIASVCSAPSSVEGRPMK